MPDVDRTDYRRRIAYHRRLLNHLDGIDWVLVERNLSRVADSIQGDLVLDAFDAWRMLVTNRDIDGMVNAFTSDTDHADLMRSISPFAGVLSDAERLSVIRDVPRETAAAFEPADAARSTGTRDTRVLIDTGL